MDKDIPYLLLTPGPLTTSRRVREAIMRDYSTWDVDYNSLVNDIRGRLVRLASDQEGYTSVLMQGSGTFAVEAVIGSVVPSEGTLLVINNGAYGQRMATIAERLGIACMQLQTGETNPPATADVDQILVAHPEVTHVAVVHCETTTGMLNPVAAIAEVVAAHGRELILDSMSGFGALEIDAQRTPFLALISSANKCFEGVPGFGFVIARRDALQAAQGRSHSLSLDLHDQWQYLKRTGQWRYTPPTHVVAAFHQALKEHAEEGGIAGVVLRRCPGLALAVWRVEQELAAREAEAGSTTT